MDLTCGRVLNIAPKTFVTNQSSKVMAMRPMFVPQLGGSGSQTTVSSKVNMQLRMPILPKALPQAQEGKEADQEQQFAMPPIKYGEFIATLPVRNDWKFMPLHLYQDAWYFTLYLDAVLEAQEKFQAQPNDIVVCTYPKTGTTWIKALVFALTTRSRYAISETPLLTSTPHDLVPFLEVESAQRETYTRDPENPLVATHIPYHSLPASIETMGCKIVYLCRDPKDVLVSMWHFLRKRLPEGIDKDAFLSMEDSFNSFCEGAAFNGPYWNHVAGYWKASQENPDKVLFMKYEDLKENIVPNVMKLAEFLGCPFTSEEEEQGVVQQIIYLCSFESLSKSKVTEEGAYSSNSPYAIKNSLFYRKGEKGDWKNYFSEEMGARLDRIIEEKLSGSGFSFLTPQ